MPENRRRPLAQWISTAVVLLLMVAMFVLVGGTGWHRHGGVARADVTAIPCETTSVPTTAEITSSVPMTSEATTSLSSTAEITSSLPTTGTPSLSNTVGTTGSTTSLPVPCGPTTGLPASASSTTPIGVRSTVGG